MAVAFVCNMNNHFFAAVRHVRERGVDAHLLLLNNESTHFHPSYDTFDLEYQSYTHTVDWGDPLQFSRVQRERVSADLAPFDVLVACGAVPAFAHKAGREVDVFVPYGSDILELPFYRLAPPRRRAISSLWEFPHAQREGLRSTRYIGGAGTPQFEEVFDRLGADAARVRVPIPPVYETDFNASVIERWYGRSNWFFEFDRIRKSSDLVLFHHARHIWHSHATPVSYKGNDKLIRGFASFLAKHQDVRPALICIEYGIDVNASKRLAAELGVDKYIHWFPMMARKELMIGVSLCDISCGEFSVSWNFGGTIVEALTMGKPLLHYRNDAMYPEEELFPIMNAHTAEDIEQGLSAYVRDPEHHQRIGLQSREWFLEHVVERGTRKLVELVTS